jgi:hypothetical protein
VECTLFLWSNTAKVVISDVDGTITKSDVMGHVMFMIGTPCRHVCMCVCVSFASLLLDRFFFGDLSHRRDCVAQLLLVWRLLPKPAPSVARPVTNPLPPSPYVSSHAAIPVPRHDLLGRDWTHNGVAPLFDRIASQGYRFVYLTSRNIGQVDNTKSYLRNITQDRCKARAGVDCVCQ